MIRSAFLVLSLFFLAPSAAATIELENDSRHFVQGLFSHFREIYAPDKNNPQKALLSYYLAHFDHPRIARFVLGSYGRHASDRQRARFAELLPRFLLNQISAHIAHYFSTENNDTHVRVVAVKPMRKDTMVHARYFGNQEIDIAVRLRPQKGTLKILDIRIADVSMLLAQRDLISSMIKNHDGNLDAFLDELRQRVLEGNEDVSTKLQ